MARPTAYLHIGLTDSGSASLGHALDLHRTALLGCGVRPLATAETSFRAAVELGWQHRAWGYQRSEVEGTWAEACRRARRSGRDTRAVVVSQPQLAGLLRHQAALAVDQLTGFRTHLVVTVAAPQGQPGAGSAPDLVEVLDRWRPAIGDPGRIHVLVAPRVDRRRALWTSFCELLDVDARRLPLRVARRELHPPAVPTSVEEHGRLTRTALGWIGALTTSGYDVRGDVSELLPAGMPAGVPTASSTRSVGLPGVLVGRP
ncbi:hypothetical protein [Nocardioides sp. SYSU DS0663]|uniref:hypothetical protein n=1 Tax=Nocardioides sp. SYSU DS0663 TaxID=3416445 RepID=UPI003F4B4DE5